MNITYTNPQANGDPIGYVDWNGFSRQDVAVAFCNDQGETYVSHINDGVVGPSGSWSIRNYNNTAWENNTWKHDGYVEVVCDDGTTSSSSSSSSGNTNGLTNTYNYTSVPAPAELRSYTYCTRAMNGVCMDSITNYFGELRVDTQEVPSSGALLVELDSSLYPIPVIDQGTAPNEVFFGSGSTFTIEGGSTVELSENALLELQQASLPVIHTTMMVVLQVVIVYEVLKRFTSYLYKKWWK